MKKSGEKYRGGLPFWGYILTAVGFVVIGVSFLVRGFLGPLEENLGVWLGVGAVVLGGLLLLASPR